MSEKQVREDPGCNATENLRGNISPHPIIGNSGPHLAKQKKGAVSAPNSRSWEPLHGSCPAPQSSPACKIKNDIYIL